VQIYDVSLPVHNNMMPFFHDPVAHVYRVRDLDKGDDANVSELKMGCHTGTHLDAPVHFVAGAPGVESLSLDDLIGPALVVEFSESLQQIHAPDLEQAGIPAGTKRVLFKTRNSKAWERKETEFRQDYCGVESDAAEWLIARGVKVVGLDHLSVCPFHDLLTTHRLFFNARTIVIEGVNLTGIKPGLYQLICMPLNIQGADGAPCRVALVA
jgi:arylformamidase